MPRFAASLASAAAVMGVVLAASGAACLDATQVTVEITTDVRCSDVKGTTLTVGSLGDIEQKPPTTTTLACDPAAARIGDIIIVPSGSTDDTVAVKVVMGLGKDPADCLPPAYGPGCIVARRALRYVPHTRLTIPIFMSAVCSGIACGATETCVHGDCRPATIPDPNLCTSPTGCGEAVLGPVSAPQVDAGPMPDAEPADTGPADTGAVDAGDACATTCLGDPSNVTLSYSAGKDQKVYRFDVTTKVFTVLNSTGCPAAEETAVMADGTMYVTSSDSQSLFRWTPALGCTSLRTGTSFPYALGTAPMGTVSATEESLVGYLGGDYVRVDRNDGAVTVVTAGALAGLLPSGDMTAIGTRGFLAAAAGTGAGAFACAATGDCIVEVNLTTGRPIKLLESFSGLGIYGLAHSHGELLFYANNEVSSYNLTTQAVTALAAWPAGASFSGAGSSAYPVP